jgi:hypothetical protein
MTMNDDDFFDLDDDAIKDDPFKGTTLARPVVRTVEEFDAEVDEKIKVLMGRRNDPKTRADAAYWLGNSGAPLSMHWVSSRHWIRPSSGGLVKASPMHWGAMKTPRSPSD